ncbi:hypothetical protein BX666DRAFT_1960683 [Dichotomocladium elegans]|nr:hypothetical protein BX666DRAFT_1960683 [Dichotomocladium elegans]
MKFTTLAYSLFALLLVSSVCAAPIEDISVTSVDVAEQPVGNKGDELLYVTVTRTDDLVDDDGSLLAERVMAVQVTFDVIENQLHCNGVPVQIGVSNIQVEAQIAANPEKLTITSEEDLAVLEDSFDIGLATVEVTAVFIDELKTEDGMTFRRLGVQERIIEINGEQVVQTDVGQQILDVFEDGQVQRWAPDELTGFLMPVDDSNSAQKDTFVPETSKGCAAELVEPLVNWWNNQSFAVQGVISGSVFAVLLAIAYLIRRMVVSAYAEYHEVPVMLSDDHQYQREVIWNAQKTNEEKRPFLSEEQQ